MQQKWIGILELLKKHKKKMLLGSALFVLLLFAWHQGGSLGQPSHPQMTEQPMLTRTEGKASNFGEKAKKKAPKDTVNGGKTSEDKSDIAEEPEDSETQEQEKKSDTVSTSKSEENASQGQSKKTASQNNETNTDSTDKQKQTAATPSPTPKNQQQSASGMLIDPTTGKDRYNTDPVPSGKPEPVEPEHATISSVAYTCTLSVRCDTILNNMSQLDPKKVELVPSDGVIFPETKVTFYEGESVFNVLQREMRRAKIHMEFVHTPMYNSAYIEGIHNLYEFDCGELSGWMYKVNDWFPNYGSSRYQLKDGDVIAWVYTCDLGRDVGDTYYALGG